MKPAEKAEKSARRDGTDDTDFRDLEARTCEHSGGNNSRSRRENEMERKKVTIASLHQKKASGQKITMIIFLCKPTSNNIQLSEEHTEHCWQHVDSGIEYFPEWIQRILEKYNSFIK